MFFLKLYDWVQGHRRIGAASLMLLVVLCALLTLRLDVKEDISDFLPVDAHYRHSMQIYQEVASANKVVLQFRSESGADSIIAAIEQYGERLAMEDSLGWVHDWAPQMDYSQVMDVTEFVYSHLPYLLDASDYDQMDSMLRQPDFMNRRFAWIQGQLASLSGSFMMPVLQYDPLGLGNRVAGHLRDFQPEATCQQQDGYLFTPDGKCCLVTIESPFGSSESGRNGQLVDLLEHVAESLPAGVSMRLTGAPVIAVGNARQIQRDTVIALSVSIVLILALLLWAFHSFRPLWYIMVSISFGFLIAMAGVSLMGVQLSFIVVGIAAMIIGIAVNYPLHFVCHRQEVGEGRRTLSDLVQPLLVGNVTTVAAFLTLVPLEAVAIRQLGLFSALMLVGTILFVLVVLPHWGIAGIRRNPIEEEATASSGWRGERWLTHPVSLGVLLLLTLFFGWHSLDTTFDSDFSHLNYMTSEQRADMQQLQALQGEVAGIQVYLPAGREEMEQMRPTLDSLLRSGGIKDEKNPSWFLPSPQLQQQRLQRWHDFWQQHDCQAFLRQSVEAGFSEEAFAPFLSLVSDSLRPMTYEEFEPLTSTILTGYCSSSSLVARLTVEDAATAAEIEQHLPGSFDLTNLNSRIACALTDNFNYIGLACACIVFLFLWLSFGRIELALLAFTPMAVGWLWILGLMQLLDIQFNIVNVILASFIFGQGDDYTIFITEGLLRDYKRGGGHRTLVSYQRSILLSAAIMLVGVGVLVLAKHPAMFSLGVVTVIGMSVVLLMAWMLPPLLFYAIIKYDKPLQRYLDERKDL